MTGLAIDSRMNTAATIGGQRNEETRPVRVCILAPSIDVLGGQSRQAERLMIGLASEPSVEIGFIPTRRGFRGRSSFCSASSTSARSCNVGLLGHGSARLWRYDVIHAYSASYWSYLLSVVPIILLAKLYESRCS